jgi:tRNA dimethylallyltransferase
MTHKECIIVAGPTAVGKTAEAIRLAKHYTTSIISADSRQCYKELNIGVARPTKEELTEVKHSFIANHSITENISAASFAKEAREYLNEIFKGNDKAIVCGGTGLYIKALVDGLDEIPPIPQKIRDQVIQLFKEKGIDAVRSELIQLDPSFPKHGDVNNPQRMMRALEVVIYSGIPIHQYHGNKREQGEIKFTYRIIDLPREELYNRINLRVDKMIQNGLEEEVRSLVAYKDLPALQTVGYKEFFEYFDGHYTKEEAIEKIKQHTRNYAKRQITWFKKFAVDG